MATQGGSNEYSTLRQSLLDGHHSTFTQTGGFTQLTVHRIPRKPVAGNTFYNIITRDEDGEKDVKEDTKDNTSPERTRHRGKAQTHKELSILMVWWQEILACWLVLGALTAILITLIAVDKKTLPKLPLHVSVNTLVAIFATILKLAAAFVLAQGLSQAKWSWYQRPRCLHDFQVYDNASRGPWGAFKLIWYLGCGPIVALLGAFVTIAATLVDPLSQQLIRVHDCDETVSGVAASLPRTRLFDEHGGHIGAGYSQMSLGLITSFATGQFSSNSPQVPFTCGTGNCTFDHEYKSVGYCSSCEDVSHHLIFQPFAPTSKRFGSINVTLSGSGSLSFDAGADMDQAVRFSMKYGASGAVSMVWYDGKGSNATYDLRGRAFQCSLTPCVHTYQAEVRNGRLLEEVLHRGPQFENMILAENYWAHSMVDLTCVNDTNLRDLSDVGYKFDRKDKWLPYNVTVNPRMEEASVGCYSTVQNLRNFTFQTEAGLRKGFYNGNSSIWTLSETGLRIVPQKCIYQMYYLVSNSLETEYIGGYFKGNLTDTFYNSGVVGPTVPLAFYSLAPNDTQTVTLQRVQDMMQNITDSMTTYMRWHGNINKSEAVTGVVRRYAVCVGVRWAYLAYSTTFGGLLIIFFIATIFETRISEPMAESTEAIGAKAPTNHDFKSSALATIFHGLDKDSLNELRDVGASNTVTELEHEAKQRLFKLLHTTQGWKLSSAHQF